MRLKACAVSAVLTILFVALAGAPLQAQQTIARSYSIIPMDGMSAQFEAALKQHIEWRVANGDPWNWGVSVVEVGAGLGEYSLRSAGHTWADLDAYDADFGPRGLQHWMATVAPVVESVSSTITTTDEALSNRAPQSRTTAFVTITRFHIRPDRQAQFEEAIAVGTQALKDHDWPGYWLWTTPMAGPHRGPYKDVVALHTSWADMQEPDRPMMAVLAEAMGQDDFEEWLADIGESTRGQETMIRRLRPDLNGR